jgi:hypothetical protein
VEGRTFRAALLSAVGYVSKAESATPGKLERNVLRPYKCVRGVNNRTGGAGFNAYRVSGGSTGNAGPFVPQGKLKRLRYTGKEEARKNRPKNKNAPTGVGAQISTSRSVLQNQSIVKENPHTRNRIGVSR